MTQWTPEEVKGVLDSRDPAKLRELAAYLVSAATLGRAFLLRKKPWLCAPSLGKEDDVQEAVAALFARSAYLLRKFGNYPGFSPSDDALKKYVIGVTFYVLQRRYQKHRTNWERIKVDIASSDEDPDFFRGFARFVRIIDLEHVLQTLSAADWELFHLIYVEQLGVPEICQRLGTTADSFQQRKTRLLKRLRTLLVDGEHS